MKVYDVHSPVRVMYCAFSLEEARRYLEETCERADVRAEINLQDAEADFFLRSGRFAWGIVPRETICQLLYGDVT
jgi:hypothetical protein